MFKNSFSNFAFSLTAVVITYLLCGYFNRIGMQNFYADIQKSALTPPNFVFPIVWTILYALMILAFDAVLNIHDKNIKPAIWLFLSNLVLQILWTFAFFAQAQFLCGLIILMVLDLVASVTITSFYRLHKISAYLLAPYLLWLMFATYLNWIVVMLNGNGYLLS